MSIEDSKGLVLRLRHLHHLIVVAIHYEYEDMYLHDKRSFHPEAPRSIFYLGAKRKTKILDKGDGDYCISPMNFRRV